jgi:hypothetical protein
MSAIADMSASSFAIASGARGASLDVTGPSAFAPVAWAPLSDRDDGYVNAVTNHERSRIMNKLAKRIALLGVISPALFAVGAMAQPIQLHSTLAGNNPNIVIGGVESAGSPWTVKSGFASLDASGKLHVKVRDLILPSTGDAGRVTM